jgi:ankyrin repeat protein
MRFGLSCLFASAVATLSAPGTGCARTSQDTTSAPINSAAKPMSSADSSPGMTITPLLAAVGAGDEARVRELLGAGANPDDPSASRSPLVQAITTFNANRGANLTCNVGIVQVLLDHGADPNRADPRIGALPLLTAFDVGDLECARIIRKAGGRTDARDEGGRTILMSAVGAVARSRNTAALDVAISWGSNPNERAQDGSSALHEAVRVNNAEVAKALLDRGADPCIRNNIGQTPLDMAINLRRPEPLVEVLRHVTQCGDSGKAR